MFSTRVLSVLCLALSFIASSRAGVLDINTPNLVQCKPAFLSWEGKYSPFDVAIIYQKNGSIIHNFGFKTGSNYTWTVDVPSGSTVAMKMTDSKGNINYSANVMIKAGTDSSCLSSVMDPSRNGKMVGTGGNATTTASTHAPLNTTLPGVSSGSMGSVTSGIGANAAATTAAGKTSSATRASAGVGFLLACFTLALVA